jgi:hypothetical protein
VAPRIDLLMERSEAGECNLVAKARIGRREVGFLYRGAGKFYRDRERKHPVSDESVRKNTHRRRGQVTYTCIPAGSGIRIALDRDEDGVWNGDELNAGSNFAD